MCSIYDKISVRILLNSHLMALYWEHDDDISFLLRGSMILKGFDRIASEKFTIFRLYSNEIKQLSSYLNVIDLSLFSNSSL